MKKLIAAVLSLFLVLGLTVQAFSGGGVTERLYKLLSRGNGTTYYVDSARGNDGNKGTSEDAAWKTLDKVNSIVLSAGDKVLFKAGGSWIGQLIPRGSGNAEDGPIVIDKYGEGALPIIDANGSTENDGAVIRLYNQEYYEISNLELRNYSNVMGQRNGVLVIAKDYGTCNHIYIRSCNIHDIAVNASKSIIIQTGENGGDADNRAVDGPACGAIVFRAVRGGDRIRTNFNDILIDSNTISKTGILGYGIAFGSNWASFAQDGFNGESWSPWYGSTNVLISNNDLKNTSAAIRLQAMDGSVGNGVIVENNVSYKPDNCDSNSGMWISDSNDVIWQYNEIYGLDNGGSNDCGAFDADGNTRRIIFQYNYTHDNRGEAVMFCNIYWDSKYEPTNAIGNIYRYNISQNDLWGAEKSHGRFWVQKGAKDSYFYNNVVYVGKGLVGKNLSIQESENTVLYNNIFINESELSTYAIHENSTYVSQNNCFYGYHPSGEPSTDKSNIVLGFDEPSPVVNAGSGGIGLDTLQGYMLTENSVCIGAGKAIDNNGGKDFFGNAVKKGAATDIGVHQTASAKDAEPPSKPSGITARADSFDRITVSWNAAADNIGIDRYVIFVNGEPIGRTTETLWTASELSQDTRYTFKVRAFDSAGNYTDSDEILGQTKKISSAERMIRLTSAATYDSKGNTAESFAAEELAVNRFTVKDAAGTPVANARVEIQAEAIDQNDWQYLAAYTDVNGVAEIGYNIEHFTAQSVKVRFKVTNVTKADRIYDDAASAEYKSLSITVNGMSTEKFGNLVRNSDFEAFDESLQPERWNIAVSDGIEASRVVNGVGVNGSAALELFANESYSALVMQNMSNVPNGDYTLTLYVKNTAPGASVTIANTGSNKTVAIPITERWQQIAVSDISVTTGRISLQINVSGNASTYTMFDNIELARNLVKNPMLKKVMPIIPLPSDYYYKTAEGTVAADSSGTEELKDSASLGAVKILNYYGANYRNAFRIGSDSAFKVTIGQTLTNLPDGNYTFSVSTVNIGSINGTVSVKGYGGETKSEKIGLSSASAVTKISGIRVTSGTATIEMQFEGTGSRDDYIVVLSPDFSMRSDYPTQSKKLVFAGDNLLSSYNPSFEEDGTVTPGAPTGWRNNWSTGTANSYATDEDAHTGKYSLRVDVVKGSSISVKPATAKFTDLPSGYYTFGAYVKGNYAVKLSATPDGAYEHDAYSKITDEWHYVSIPNIKVSDGVITVGFWNTTGSTDTKWALIDDAELYLQENYLVNADFEKGISTGWKTQNNIGFSEIKETAVAYSGKKALRMVLPGTPSQYDIAADSVLTNLQPGRYVFSAWVKGTSVVEMYLAADGKEETVTSVRTGDDWQQITLIANVDDMVKSLGIRALNPDNTTSSYVTVDSASFIRLIMVDDIASMIGDLKTVQKHEKYITLPKMREGFGIELISSSDISVVALDSSVTTPDNDTTVILTFKVYSLSNPSDYRLVTSSVKVIGKGIADVTFNDPPAQEDKITPTETSNNNNVVDNTPILPGVLPAENDDTINDSVNEGINNHPSGGIESVEKSGDDIFLMLLLGAAAFSILAFSGIVMLALKKKAEEKN